jgi:hypothetical protein
LPAYTEPEAPVSFVYFACDWLIDDVDKVDYVMPLMRAAKKAQVELRRGMNPSGDATDEGYRTMRYVVMADTLSRFHDFTALLPPQSGLADWIPISSEYHEKFCFLPDGRPLPSIVEDLNRGIPPYFRGYLHTGARNKELQEKLQQNPGLTYGYDWIVSKRVPLSSPDSRIYPPEVVESPPYNISYDAFDISLGCGIRGGGFGKTSDGFHTFRFIGRVFSQSELEQLSEKTGLELSKWFAVPVEDYLKGIRLAECHPYYSEPLKELCLQAERLGQENERLNNRKSNPENPHID